MSKSGAKKQDPARIRVLPDAVVNKIAAGEVVERPASVVKELMENALDAGATQVSVTLAEGGKTDITVLDNGHGMMGDDALLAIQRHATSKIADESELSRITTLGFRGEALASIAAVSRFELVTCADESTGGTRVTVEGGRVTSKGRIGFPRGTKIVVEDLFHNTPARQKFLRAQSTEYRHVHAIFTQLALAHPYVHFRLTQNRRLVHDLLRCEALPERVYQLYGAEMRDGLVSISGSEGTLAYEGLISSPSHSRGSRRWQFLMLNRRPIRDTRVNHAVYQAYRTLLMKDRHPAFILNLRLDPSEVDVNVHPTKSEVRLRNPQWVHTVLATRLYGHLMEHSRDRFLSVPSSQAGGDGPAPSHPAHQIVLPHTSSPAFPFVEVQPVHDHAASEGQPSGMPPGADGINGPPAGLGGDRPGGGLRDNPFSSQAFHFQPLSVPAAPQEIEPGAGWAGEELAVLGQFHATYILAQRSRALILVDQHAAHERILFEQLRTQYYQGQPVGERFLLPLNVELSAQNALLLEQYLPQWNRLGFEIEPFGRHTFLVRQVPALLSGKDIEALLLESLDELALFGKSGKVEEVINDIMERVACHSAIRGGMHLSREEMDALLDQLKGLDINLYCPHGRPAWIEIPLSELEKRFKRIV